MAWQIKTFRVFASEVHYFQQEKHVTFNCFIVLFLMVPVGNLAPHLTSEMPQQKSLKVISVSF